MPVGRQPGPTPVVGGIGKGIQIVLDNLPAILLVVVAFALGFLLGKFVF